MFKTSFFLAGPVGSDPFRRRGEEAAQAISGHFPGLAGYTQTRTLNEQVDPSADSPFTGVAELWFADAEAARDAEALAGELAALLVPETEVAATASGMIRTVMRRPAFYQGDFIKGVFPFRRQATLSVEAFQRYWWQKHGPIAALTESALCYTQCHPLAGSYATGRPAFDGITELYWPDVTAARSAMGSRQMIEDQATDSQNFAEPGSVILFLAGEEVIIPA
jgi:uncharacterized protein (TIGR02118 family)